MYEMNKDYFDILVNQLKEIENGQDIIHGFTSCILDTMFNDSAFLSVKNNREQRNKIVEFQLDLLEKTR